MSESKLNMISAREPRITMSVFAGLLIASALLSALMASWLPLQVSIVTVFLFAGPHNWFEFRYFLMRLPFRFGRSRNFFLIAFAGIAFLTVTYISLPLFYAYAAPTPGSWATVLASWNTLLLLWIGLLVWLRGKQRSGRDWSWGIAAALGLSAINWLQPEFFSLAIVYLHPLIALWFLDRHLRINRPHWLPVYRRCLYLLPVLVVGIVLAQSRTLELADDNGLFWRITQHAGADLLPNIPSRILVSVHLFLEMLHYAVWIVALSLIGPTRQPASSSTEDLNPAASQTSRSCKAIWDVRSVPLARHSRGFPKTITAALGFGVFLVFMLWIGFSMDYSTTRDLYFTVAIAHVVAEAPFLLKML